MDVGENIAASYPPQKVSSTENLFFRAKNEEHLIKAIMEQELEQYSWVRIKENIETNNRATIAVCSKPY